MRITTPRMSTIKLSGVFRVFVVVLSVVGNPTGSRVVANKRGETWRMAFENQFPGVKNVFRELLARGTATRALPLGVGS